MVDVPDFRPRCSLSHLFLLLISSSLFASAVLLVSFRPSPSIYRPTSLSLSPSALSIFPSTAFSLVESSASTFTSLACMDDALLSLRVLKYRSDYITQYNIQRSLCLRNTRILYNPLTSISCSSCLNLIFNLRICLRILLMLSIILHPLLL